jgi:imidazolonepropionase
MLIHSASQLVTLAGGPRRGTDPEDPVIIENGALLIHGERILEVGESLALLKKYPHEEQWDASGKVVMPGLVDPHTHLVWAGDRAAEFEARLQGSTYMEIMAAGGGINATVRATREASAEELYAQTRARAEAMFRSGTTTTEAKTGYGLTFEAEIAQLEVLLRLDAEGPLEIAPTFMAAHAVPPEYAGRSEEYTRLVSTDMLPRLKEWWMRHHAARPLPFVDVFCENNAFNLTQTRQILTRAKELGFPLKVHVDEFENLGGAALAVELGAVSIEHAVKTSPQEIAAVGASDPVSIHISEPTRPISMSDAGLLVK